MKKLFTFAIIGMAGLAMILATGSCKKEAQNTTFDSQKQSSQAFDPSQIADMNAYLEDFKQKMTASQNCRDVETLSLEEAAWHLSSVANYDFANANVEFTDLRYDTLQYHVNVTNGQVSLSELNEVYQHVASDIDAFYQNLDLQDKHFRFIGANITENGQVRVSLITTYFILDHTWYFANDFEAGLFCYEWFDENATYVWNTTAVSLLSQAINFLEGREFVVFDYPPIRTYYVYTMDIQFNHYDYIDPYGSPFLRNSRLFAGEADTWAVPTLTFNQMCYCVDSYTELPFWYVNQYVSLENQRPVHWTIIPNVYQLQGAQWHTFNHIVKVKLGYRVTNDNPIQY